MATVMSVWRRLVNHDKKLVCLYMPFFRRKSHFKSGEISSRFGKLLIQHSGTRKKSYLHCYILHLDLNRFAEEALN